MGMSSDYLEAVKSNSTFIRVGSLFLVIELKDYHLLLFFVLNLIFFKSFF